MTSPVISNPCNLCFNSEDLELLKTHQIETRLSRDGKSGIIKCGRVYYRVQSPNANLNKAIPTEEWAQIAAKVSLILIKKDLLSINRPTPAFKKATLNHEGVLLNGTLGFRHTESQQAYTQGRNPASAPILNTKRDYEDLAKTLKELRNKYEQELSRTTIIV